MGRYLVVGFLAYLVAGCGVVALLNAKAPGVPTHLPASLSEADVISEGLDR